MIFEFANCRVDTDRRQLFRDGEQVAIEPKALELLLYLIANCDRAVGKDELQDQVWGTIVTDAALARAVMKLRKSLADTSSPPAIIKTVPKFGYHMVATVREIDSKSETPKAAARPGRPVRNLRYVNHVITAVVIVAAIAVVLTTDWTGIAPGPESAVEGEIIAAGAPDRSVAVLPFVNIGSDDSNRYFSDGLTETLLHKLAQFPELKVAARTSSFAFAGQDADINEIGQTLGVAHVLEGSVQRVGNRVRIIATLIRASDGFSMWTADFDRDLTDIFAVQDEISASVAESLIGSINEHAIFYAGPGLFGARDPQAYDTYLQALTSLNQNTFDSLKRGEELLKEALTIDPMFREARLALAKSYVEQTFTGSMTWAEAKPQAEVHLRQLLTSDPGDSRAAGVQQVVRGYDAMVNANKALLSASVAEIGSILSVTPNEIWLYPWQSLFLSRVGEFDAAITWAERGLGIDPLSPVLHSRRGQMLFYSHRLDEAARAFQRVRELAPVTPGGWYSGGMVALQQEDYASYVPLMLRSMEIDPNDHELLLKFADALLVLGLLEEAEPWHQEAIRLAPESPSTRRFELDRFWARSEYKELRDHAEEMLLDQVENRWGADTAAASYYVYSQRQLGALEEVQPFFERIYPGISNPDTIVGTSRGFWIKMALMDALFVIDPEQAASHARVVAGYVKDRFPAFLERVRLRIGLLNTIGDRDAAIELALAEDFGARVVSGIANFKPDQAYEFFNTLRPLLSDPAIAARASEFRVRREQQAELVRLLLRENAQADLVD